MSTYTEINLKLEEFLPCIELSLTEIEEIDACSKALLRYFVNTKCLDQFCLIKLQAILDYVYEKINIGNWKDVKLYLRKTITIASFLKLIGTWKDINNFKNDIYKNSFKIIDFGLVFGCPLETDPELLQKCATLLHGYAQNECSSQSHQQVKLEPDEPCAELKYNTTALEVLDRPSLEFFYKNYIMKGHPVILDNCINHWPALTKWKDQNYFIKQAGLRTVSVELGSSYIESDWTQKLMTIEEFVNDHIYQSNGPTGYLAQYQLFNQIPELKNDIAEPEYCCFAESDEPVDIMAWYGPKGTVSPLHHDPKRNLLAQVIGQKQIFLFSPADTENLYPHEHELLNNTARIDPRNPNFDLYPKYREATAYYCVLKPGQMLYIPPKWWHFVESLSVSFSISFWWN